MKKPSPQPEIVASDSSVVYKNRWMQVREDRIVRASGATGVYGVVEKTDFVVIAAFQDGALHLVEQYRYPVSARYWEFPQGSSHLPGVTAVDLAAAELREETGLAAASMVHVGRLFPSYGFATQAFDVYLATGLSYVGLQLEPEEEGLITRTFSVAAVEQMVIDGTIQDASTVAAFGLLRLKGLV
ncbi:MAG: NUDIX hydrolase [Polaromonas sp.]|uniref:NUDIX hydrolase n=1 Tax=Polaromonas sp. TaxID=1869339 RepID=UPI0032636752